MKSTLPSSQTIEHTKQSRTRVPYLVAHPMVSSIVILVLGISNIVAQRLYDWQDFIISFEVGLTIIGFCIPLIAAFIYRKFCSLLPVLKQILDVSPEFITDLFNRQKDAISGDVVTYAAYALFATAADTTMIMLTLPWSVGVNILFLVFFAVLMVALATVGWIYTCSLVVLTSLGNFDVKGSAFEWPEKEFADLNGIYMEMYTVAVLLYLGFIVSIWFVPVGRLLVLYHPLGRFWIFPIAGITVYYFLACQYYIHRLIKNSKQRRIGEMNKMLTKTLDNWLLDQSVDKAKLVTELSNWRNRVRQDLDWPLDFKSILVIVSGLLLPTIKTLIDLVSQ